MGDLGSGVRYLGRGQKWVLRNGRWFGFGLLPALITLVLYAAALTALAFWADDLAAWATPFADDWESPWPGLLRGTFTVVLFAGGLLLAALTFTAVALLVGDPFYEALSEKVEESEGGGPEGPDRPLWRELWISLRDSLHILLRVAVLTVPLFVLGFVPVIGQTIVPALGFAVSGFFLTAELTSVALQRRDIPVRERLRLLRGRKALALGFGVPLVLAFLLPLVAVFLMPGAVAGATLLARDLVDDRADGNAGAPGDGSAGPATATPPAADGTD
ncbi:EI24 domain-containing protein [Streptomyces megasporus]|uniref:EI24 domain-containing protein n=1 Tax=Streptomyces megasporus TaxID=44060 RepID=UPI000997919E|nr:EI24 domain-containing protein [Streptomyces megasporus]